MNKQYNKPKTILTGQIEKVVKTTKAPSPPKKIKISEALHFYVEFNYLLATAANNVNLFQTRPLFHPPEMGFWKMNAAFFLIREI